ncbi:MAG: Gfo/Idh/MocA family oxidoreductase [Peptostreptococcaceae bacterium]
MNIGIIGSGVIAKKLIEATFKIESINLYAFYSRNEETADEFKKSYNFQKTFTNLEKMAKDKNLDAVYIASPNSIHFEQAILFMKNKKHVLCEKAFASNSKEVEKMIEVSKVNKVILMEAIKTIYLPGFQTLKDNIHKIGKIRKYFSSHCKYSSRYEDYKNNIIQNAFKKELSNGALMDIGVYSIYPLIYLFGKPKSTISESIKLSTGVDGQGSSILKYDDMESVVIFSKISNSNLPSEIIGEKGSILINKINEFSEIEIIYNNGEKEKFLSEKVDNDLYFELLEFYGLIQNKDFNECEKNLTLSLNVMNVLDSIRKDIDIEFKADKIIN